MKYRENLRKLYKKCSNRSQMHFKLLWLIDFIREKIIKIPQIGVKIVFKSLKCILTTFQPFQNTVGKGLLIIKASTCNWGQIHRGFSLTVLLIYLNFYDCNQVWILLRDAFHSKKPNKQTSFVQIKRIWGKHEKYKY